MPPFSFFRLIIDKRKSTTDGTYEYYYTVPYRFEKDGILRHISLKHPNISDTDVIELGIYDGVNYYPLYFNASILSSKEIKFNGTVGIKQNEKIYAKVTGTAADSDVDLVAYGNFD